MILSPLFPLDVALGAAKCIKKAGELAASTAEYVADVAESAVETAVQKTADYIDSVNTKKASSRQETICHSLAEVENGDVLRVSRGGGLYDHYGIYVKENHHVIHYTGNGGKADFNGTVRETDFWKFLGSASSFVVCRFPAYISSLDELSVYEHPLETTMNILTLTSQPEPLRTIKNAAGLACGAIGITSVTGRALRAVRETKESSRVRNYHLYSGEETVARARSLLGENLYNLAINNCEHFAVYCKTGLRESSQVNGVINSIESLGIPIRDML